MDSTDRWRGVWIAIFAAASVGLGGCSVRSIHADHARMGPLSLEEARCLEPAWG